MKKRGKRSKSDWGVLKEETKEIDASQIQNLAKKLLPCPFCGCTIDLVVFGGGFGFGWTGEHKDCCIIEMNPSHCYGRPESLLNDWNRRYKK